MATLRDVIGSAITFEEAAQGLYLRFAEEFWNAPAAHGLWLSMASDESGHRTMLSDLLESMPAELLEEAVESRAASLRDSAMDSVEDAAGTPIPTLDDAYEVAHMLESSEVNALFMVLMTYAPLGEADSRLVTVEVDQQRHVGRLEDFAAAFDRTARRAVSAEP